MKEFTGQEAFVNQVATTICRYGLRGPALLMLQVGHPLTFLSAQLLWLAQPVLSLFTLSHLAGQLATLMEEPTAVQALITHLETEEAGAA